MERKEGSITTVVQKLEINKIWYMYIWKVIFNLSQRSFFPNFLTGKQKIKKSAGNLNLRNSNSDFIAISYIFCALFFWRSVRKTDLMKAVSTDPFIQQQRQGKNLTKKCPRNTGLACFEMCKKGTILINCRRTSTTVVSLSRFQSLQFGRKK